SQELAPPRGRPGETPPTSVSESLPTLSDSDVPPATEDCPSILADGLEESDEDSERPGRGVAGACDPLPAPLKDPCPLPAQPGICMVDPEALPPGRKEPPGSKGKKTLPRAGSAAPKAEPPRVPTSAAKARPASAVGDKSRPPLGDKKGPSSGGTARSATARAGRASPAGR
ncbi:MAP1S protein, partial [Hippolais icterina]|nr:MAP1S protein [Hippolais icterina]